MVQLEERESICSMLRDTLKILIKNGLTFKRKFNVEGLLGITVDDGEDVFLVSVNELVKSELQANQSLELEVETIEDQELSFMAESSPSRRKRKRRRNTKNPESVSSDEDVADALLPNEVSPIGQAISLEKDSKSTSLTKSNSSGFQNITIKQEIDEESWLEENQDYATEPSSADQSLMDSSQGVSDMYDRSLTDQMPGPSGSQEELFDSYGLKQNKKRNFPCQVCTRTFQHNKNLREHVMSAHSGLRPICSLCDKDCLPSNIFRHISSCKGVRSYGCSACETTFTEKSNAVRHVGRYCKEKDGKPMLLKIGEDETNEITKLVNHSMEEYRRKIKENKRSEVIPKRPKFFNCQDCSKSFKRNQKLQEHRMNVHCVGDKSVCPICGKSCLPSVIGTHIREHNEIPEYACSSCGGKYNNKQNYTRHINNKSCAKRMKTEKDETKKSKYSCTICGGEYRQRKSYTRHFGNACAWRAAGRKDDEQNDQTTTLAGKINQSEDCDGVVNKEKSNVGNC